MLKYPCRTYFHGKIMINPSNPGFFPCFSQQFMRYQAHQPHHFPHVFPPESRYNSAPSGIRSAAAPRSLRSDGYKPRAWARGEEYHHRPPPKGCRWMERDSSLQPIESRPLVAWWFGGFEHSEKLQGEIEVLNGGSNGGCSEWEMVSCHVCWRIRVATVHKLLVLPCLTPLKWPNFISRQQVGALIALV